jgi:hypothetical protein
MVGMARTTQFLAWLRNGIDEFFREDHVSKDDSAAGVEQGPSQGARRPIWDGWIWPEPRTQRQASDDTASKKTAGPVPPRVVAQGALGAHAEFRKEGR